MKEKYPLLLLISLAAAGCAPMSSIDQVRQNQRANNQLLEQQAVRMEMQEEYLEQLAESQQQTGEALTRVSGQLGQLLGYLSQELTAESEAAADEAAPDEAGEVSQEIIDTAAAGDIAQDKVVLGRNEWAWLALLDRNLKARIDTGAASSSLNAIDLQPFERDGQDWIRFRVPDEEHPDGGDVYETPLIKHVRIRQASADELERRPVVRLTVRMGELIDDVEFNLTNRQDMVYPLLLGRNFLRDVALVDVARKFTQPKHVPEVSLQLQ